MPKSRGRRTKSGGSKPVRHMPPRQLRRSDLMLRDARQLVGEADPLQAEFWASGWLGAAWSSAALSDRDAEQQLCLEICGRACSHPSPHGLAAVAALARVAPPQEAGMLEETVGILAATQPLPPWHTSGPDAPWKPAGAWRAVDVWESERVLFIEYDGPHPHTLMAQICQTGGILVTKLAVLQVGAAEAWDTMREDEDVPMPITEQPVAEVLGDLAASLRMTDMTWPRHDDDDFTDHRALAWARCRDHLPDWPDEEGLPGSERERLIEAFTVTSGRDDVSRSLAELFLDYGEGYIRAGPLCWSSGEVMLFLTDWLPRKAMLDAAQRQALPGVLRQWLAFALTERGLDPKWITQVTDAVDTFVPEFRDAFGDQTAWGPAKQIVAELMDRGIDLTDREAIDSAIHALNAERLARQLTD